LLNLIWFCSSFDDQSHPEGQIPCIISVGIGFHNVVLVPPFKYRLVQKNGTKSQKPFKIEVENLIANYTKLTPAMIYKFIKMGKLKKIGISGIDKPGARETLRVWKSEVDRYLGK
jgi:hypothetical protein